MITSNNAIYQSDDDNLVVQSGAITITGENGGFEQSVTRFDIGTVGQPASAVLNAAAGPVSFTIENPDEPGFSAATQIGVDGEGELSLLNGASVRSINNGYYDADIASFAPGSAYNINIGNRGDGVVTVDGDGSFLGAYGVDPRITVGRGGGTGTLNVQNGGKVGTHTLEAGRNADSEGTVNVSGAGSVLQLDTSYGLGTYFNGTDFSGFGPDIRFGRDDGTGVLNITDGGTVNIENVDGETDGSGLRLGRDGGSTGILRVEGEGSTLNVIQNGAIGDDNYFGAGLSVGRTGQGLAYISDGGQVNITGDDAFVGLGQDNGDGDLTDRQNLLRIETGGKLVIDSGDLSGGGINIAESQGSNGRIEVLGDGSEVLISSAGGSVYGPFLQVGRRGEGELIVSDGGKISIDGNDDRFPIFFVGVADRDGVAKGTGYAKISGPGSSVTVIGDNPDAPAFLAVGRRAGAEGELIIENGGVVEAIGGLASMEIAGGSPGDTGFLDNSGIVTVTGDGSRLSLADHIAVGGDNGGAGYDFVPTTGGNGRLNVTNGGTVTASGVSVGNFGVLSIANAEVAADVLVTGQTFAGGEDTIATSTITGDFTQTSGQLEFEINDFTEGAADVLQISGDATVSDAAFVFDVSGVQDFDVGDEFAFLSAGGALNTTIADAATFIGNEDNFDFEIREDTVDDGAGGTQSVLVLSVTDTTIIGTNGPDEFEGGAGTDVFDGGRGADIILGAGGNDTLSGGGGGDELQGGRGADLLTGGGGRDMLFGNGGRDQLDGGGGRDFLNGGGGADTLNGGGGRDDLQGAGGKDMLFGQGGRDTLDGGNGRDTLDGGAGADQILGGRGLDQLIGGGGRDRFIFSDSDSRDVIQDFQQSLDRIEITDGAETFADLNITQFGDNVRISFANTRVTVLDDDVDNFTAADFVFS